MAAYRRLDAAPEWAWSAGAPIATGSLTLVLTGKIAVHRFETEDGDDTRTWVQVPQTLKAGWYVATMSFNGRRQQTILQVTDLAAYAMVTQTRSVVWVNGLDNAKPVRGATVTVAGRTLGRTDADGLRIGTTPSLLKKASAVPEREFVVVRDGRDRAVFVPVGEQAICGKCYDGDQSDGNVDTDAWWHVLATDRDFLRQTDQVNVWGIVRARDDGSLPRTLEIRLQAYDDWTQASIPIVTARPTPSASGLFTATLTFTDVPLGEYEIAMFADGQSLGSSTVRIGPIVKPAWQLAVTTDRSVMSGDSIDVSANATFFEGTPVAGVEVRIRTRGEDDEYGDTPEMTMQTGPDGLVTKAVKITLPTDVDDPMQWDWQSIGVVPDPARGGRYRWPDLGRRVPFHRADGCGGRAA